MRIDVVHAVLPISERNCKHEPTVCALTYILCLVEIEIRDFVSGAYLHLGMAQKVQAWEQPSATRRYAVWVGVNRCLSHSALNGTDASPTYSTS